MFHIFTTIFLSASFPSKYAIEKKFYFLFFTTFFMMQAFLTFVNVSL